MSWCCFDFFFKSDQDIDSFESLKNVNIFSYNEIKAATNTFCPSNILGKGGFGIVYKGELKDGTQIAAKMLSAKSEQGLKEFFTEIESISNLQHTNLVKLIGCSVQRDKRILIYEYLPNNSLDQALLGLNDGKITLNWGTRSAICKGTAVGLSFLHDELEPCIVHRDIKASNILLDENFVPKIGDFGLAKLFPNNVTHISTQVVGTFGYLAPEYAVHGQLTKKADVYSFGVLLLEVISGKRISQSYNSDSQMFLVQLAWHLYEKERLLDIVDPNLKEYSKEEVTRYVKVALFCTQMSASRRPCMAQVVDMLSRPMKMHDNELKTPYLIHDMKKKNNEAFGSPSFTVARNSAVWTPSSSSASFSQSQISPR